MDRVLIGRSEQVDLIRGISSNYACQNCCPNNFYDGWLTPAQSTGFEGDQMQFIAMQQDMNCYGQVYPAYQAGFPSFTSSDLSICNPDWTTGTTTGVGPGEAIINGVWTGDAWLFSPTGVCDYTPAEVLREALCEVLAPDRFYAVSVTQTDPECPPGYYGYGAEVRYGVANMAGIPLTKSGMTPRERFFVNGIPNSFVFLAFATPPETNSQGLFTDRPVGTCFNVSPFSTLNPCVGVVQVFDIVVPNVQNSPYSISTVTRRHDCRWGIKVEVENGPVVQTYTLGQVP